MIEEMKFAEYKHLNVHSSKDNKIMDWKIKL
jgi:hypothetical protein